MNEKTKRFLITTVCIVSFISSVFMTVMGNMAEGYSGIFLSLTGLVILLLLLYLYNRQYK